MENGDLIGHIAPVEHRETSTAFGTPCDSQFYTQPGNQSNVQIVCRINAPQRQNVTPYSKGMKHCNSDKKLSIHPTFHGISSYATKGGAPLRSSSIAAPSSAKSAGLPKKLCKTRIYLIDLGERVEARRLSGSPIRVKPKSNERKTSKSKSGGGSRNNSIGNRPGSGFGMYTNRKMRGLTQDARYCAFTTQERSNRVVLCDQALSGRLLNEHIADTKELQSFM